MPRARRKTARKKVDLTKPPLLIHLLFHPDSKNARELALRLHAELNADHTLPGLRIPTVFAPEDDETKLPPAGYSLDEADNSIAVVLADDHMVVRPDNVPEGRQSWSSFVGDLRETCRRTDHRFIPIQLTDSAWPLDPHLRGTSFLRGVLYAKDKEKLATEMTRALIVETCRFLLGKERGESVPLRLFLSHAKQDMEREPRVIEELVSALNATKPIETWVDSSKIERGSQFGEEIEKGVENSALLAVVTQNYASRPWCRREILLAKRHQRPLVVISALEGLEAESRSFPYVGNVPRIRWQKGAANFAIDLILKETLRRLHIEKMLERVSQPKDVILSSPPELITLVPLRPGASVLYPDPPLGDEEVEEIYGSAFLDAPNSRSKRPPRKNLNVEISTPLQRAGKNKILKDRQVALSISESDDIHRFGLATTHLDAALLGISQQLLARGASLRYGGHLGGDGYTVKLFNLVWAHRRHAKAAPPNRIINDVGWPLPYQKLPVETRAKNQAVADYRRVPRPDGVEDLEPETFIEEPEFFPPSTPERRYAWGRGMTAMRENQANSDEIVGRIVLGGKFGPLDGSPVGKWYMGRIPGVVEEVLLSLRASQPVFLVGAFGGAAKLAIDLLEGRNRAEFTWDFQKSAPNAEGMRKIYEKRDGGWEDYPKMTKEFREMGVTRVAMLNKLSLNQNRELFESRDLTRITELLIEGLTKLA
ncbi:MAG: hypothetical protein ACI8UO_002977 [Verrucomicrobiales bacterium]|jgi:hypothetical protein